MQAGEYNYTQNNTEPTQYEDDALFELHPPLPVIQPSQANACGNRKLPFNVGCQNTASQIQGDENVVSQAAEQVFP